MPAETTTVYLAVLIDADNASPKIADSLFEEIANGSSNPDHRPGVQQLLCRWA